MAAAAGGGIYEVSQLAQAKRSMLELFDKASHLGIQKQYLEAWDTIVAKLQMDPTGWGDPEYRLRKKGSMVCHAVSGPLFVRYVVYKLERKVMILTISALPTGPLA